MASAFTWLDSSEHERRRALEVIDLFGQSETVDELGLGTVRDTIAEVLTPGTSTVQTRARYFFFLPWTYQTLDRRSPIEKASEAARRLEISLIGSLSKADDPAGTIGIQSGAALQRLPSTIYWAGLARLGFRTFQGSIDQYHRVLERGIGLGQRDETNDVSLNTPFRGTWHPHLPAAPDDFPEKASFELTRSEADFFKAQLEVRAPDSMVLFLVNTGESLGDLEFPWMHPALSDMSPDMQHWLSDGRNFSEIMVGAQYLYNLMLSEAKKVEETRQKFESLLDQWAEQLGSRRGIYESWNRNVFWQRLRRVNPRLPEGVRLFSEGWMTMALAIPAAKDLSRHHPARQLIANRESQLKGARARLKSQTHLDLWRGASGTEPLNYRWPITKRVVNDIIAGLTRGNGRARST